MVAALTTEPSPSEAAPPRDLPIENSSQIDDLNEREAFDALPAGQGRGRALTARQAAVLQFIIDHKVARGYPPTFREIGKAFGIRSTNGVNDHLRALERKGHIVRSDLKSRGIRVVNALTGAPVAEPPDPLGFLKAENEALRSLLRRVAAAGSRVASLSAEMVIVLGDVRAVLRIGGGL